MARRKTIQALVAWAPAIGLMAFIFFLSNNPAPEFLRTHYIDFQDKFMHCVAYFVLGSLYLRALLWGGAISLRRGLAVAIPLTMLYGASDEWHQSFVPSRSADFVDWAADAIGACFLIPFAGLLRTFLRWEKRVWTSLPSSG